MSNLIKIQSFLLAFLISSFSYAGEKVQPGDEITSKRFNESVLQIGSIQTSLLTEGQFQSLSGDCWVKIDGRDITGSDLANITGMSTLPDATGRFLRNIGGKAPALRNTQEDAFQSHKHLYLATDAAENGNNGSHTHSGSGANREVGDTGFSGYAEVGNNGTPRATDETRPSNLGVNMFIKINHKCN